MSSKGKEEKKRFYYEYPTHITDLGECSFRGTLKGEKKLIGHSPPLPPSPPSSLRSPLRNLGWRPETECVAGSLGVGYVVQGRPVLDGCNVMCDATQGGSVAVPGIGIRISRPSLRSLVGVVRGCKGVRFA